VAGIYFQVDTAVESWTFVQGQTLTITNSMIFQSSSKFQLTVKSSISTDPTYIDYTGPLSNQNIYLMAFTDVNATGTTLNNYYGSTLTRTTNIVNTKASSGSSGFFIQ